MQIPDIPDASNLLIQILVFLGLSATIGNLIGLAFAIASYIGPAKTAARGGLVVLRIIKAIARMPPVAGILSLATFVLVPVAHLLTLALVFLGGNYATVTYSPARLAKLELITSNLPRIKGWETLLRSEWYQQVYSAIRPFLELNLVTGAYLAVATICLLASYRVAWRGGDVSALGYVVAAPIFVFMWLGIAGIAVTAFFTVIFGIMALVGLVLTGHPWMSMAEVLDYVRPAGFILTATLICAAYVAACQAAVNGPILLARIMRNSSGPARRLPISK